MVFSSTVAFHFVALKVNILWEAVMGQWTWPTVTESVNVKIGDMRD